MQEYWIWLDSRKHIGAVGKLALLERFSDPQSVYRASRKDLQELKLDAQSMESLLDRDLVPARQIIHRCAAQDIRILTLGDEAYPKRLKNISDPPLVL